MNFSHIIKVLIDISLSFLQLQFEISGNSFNDENNLLALFKLHFEISGNIFKNFYNIQVILLASLNFHLDTSCYPFKVDNPYNNPEYFINIT